MAVLHLGDNGYGTTIRSEIESRTGRSVARGAVYITLDRLEEKGLLTSKLSAGTEVRGGRPRRLFHVTAAGINAVKHSMRQLVRMHRGLESLLGEL